MIENNKIKSALHAAKDKTVIVIGDVMLDHYVFGKAERLSPEGPIPVLLYTDETYVLGGAANVAANLAGLGLAPKLIGVIGTDDNALKFKSCLKSHKIDHSHILATDQRPTTTKTRYVSGSAQIMRLDREAQTPVSNDESAQILRNFENLASQAKQGSLLILSDYNKGVLHAALLKKIIKSAKAHEFTIIADPKKSDISVYEGVDVLTPNLKELRTFCGADVANKDDTLENAVKPFLKALQNTKILLTRSEMGMSLYQNGADTFHARSRAQDVFDVSGAGDTVIATLGALIAGGLSIEDAIKIANKAAAIVIGKKGTAAIDLNALTGNADNSAPTIAPHLSWDEAAVKIKEWQAQGLKVGFTNGCFDILHYGHVNYLAQARALCDKLVMGLNTDQSIKILKGPDRPVNDQNARAAVIGSLASIDLVVPFGAENDGEDNTPCALLDKIRPDIIFKGGDYKVENLPEARVVMAYGGEVEIMPLYEGHSTTNTIEKMKKSGT